MIWRTIERNLLLKNEVELQIRCRECLTYTMCKERVYKYIKSFYYLIIPYKVSAKQVHMAYFNVIYTQCPSTMPYMYAVKSGKHIIKHYHKILDYMRDEFDVPISEMSIEKYVGRLDKYIKENKKRDHTKFSLVNTCSYKYSFLNKRDYPYDKL